jgi:hypothetical protein
MHGRIWDTLVFPRHAHLRRCGRGVPGGFVTHEFHMASIGPTGSQRHRPTGRFGERVRPLDGSIEPPETLGGRLGRDHRRSVQRVAVRLTVRSQVA